jgi:hypothetical protein
MYLKKVLMILFLGLFIAVTAVAQDDLCPDLVRTALASADQWCQATSRNQACYGNNALTAQLQAGSESNAFSQVGDIVDISVVQSLQLNPLDTTNGVWGVVFMRIQANLPDTLPGQNVTMLLFGDTEITPVDPATSGVGPMQAFYLKTGIGNAACEEVPSSGLLVQTPEGVEHIQLSVNGVQIQMGSTVFFQAQRDGNMTVTTVEGAARVEADGEIETAIAGTQVNVPLDENLLPTAAPESPIPYDEEEVVALPIDNLEREIEIAPPLSEDELNLFLEYEDTFESIDIDDQSALLDFLTTAEAENLEDVTSFLTDELGYSEDLFVDSQEEIEDTAVQPSGDEIQPDEGEIEGSDQSELSEDTSETDPSEESDDGGESSGGDDEG